LFDIEAHILLKRLQELTKEPYSDEFQLLSTDAIETLALEFDKEIEFFED
jgi:small GTP-binding protein